MSERPSVTLKLATSLDGRIATAAGESRWITGEAARLQVHRLRAEHQAVLVGAQTAIRDDPVLKVRTPGYEGPQPLRVVLDTHQRTPMGSKLVAARASSPAAVTASSRSRRDRRGRPRHPGQRGRERLDLPEVFAVLMQEGVSRLFVEGGGRVAASFIRRHFVAGWNGSARHHAGRRGQGGDRRPAGERMAQAVHLRRLSVQELGDDLWERYERV